MSVEVANPETTSSDPLRLTFCPQCDYSLQGLPPEGICPECGRAYDQSFVIVRGGFAVRAHDPAAYAGSVRWLVTWGAVVGVLFWWWWRSHDLLFLFALAYSILQMAFVVIEWVISPRAGAALVWISPLGIGQQNAFDPSALHVRLARWLPALYGFGFVAVLSAPLARGGTWPWYILLVLVGGGLMSLPQTGGRIRFAVPTDGIRPPLIAWARFRKIMLRPRRNGRYHLRAQYQSWVARTYPINVVLTMDPATADELRRRIQDLSRRIVVRS